MSEKTYTESEMLDKLAQLRADMEHEYAEAEKMQWKKDCIRSLKSGANIAIMLAPIMVVGSLVSIGMGKLFGNKSE